MRYPSEIYKDLQNLRAELEQLRATGKVTMSTDSWNSKHTDVEAAFEKANSGIETALSATAWMEVKRSEPVR